MQEADILLSKHNKQQPLSAAYVRALHPLRLVRLTSDPARMSREQVSIRPYAAAHIKADFSNESCRFLNDPRLKDDQRCICKNTFYKILEIGFIELHGDPFYNLNLA